MHVCIFEDQFSENFFPLTCFRPVYDLRCGILTLREKILAHLPADSVSLFCRGYLHELVAEQNPDLPVNRLAADEEPCLFVNGRCIMTTGLKRILGKGRDDAIFVSGNELVAARLSGTALVEFGEHILAQSRPERIPESVKKVDVDVSLASYPWDLLYANEGEILHDFLVLTGKGKRIRKNGKVHRTAVLIGRKVIHIGKKSDIGPGVVLDASDGPIYIGQRVKILPHAVIEGPACICDGSLVKSGTRIGRHTTIGPVSKVAGEIEHSIILSYSNKQHDGYLGHSYLGSWVNLGAGTTTSNLKNTYGNITVHINGKPVQTGRMFIGLTAGDHVKTGINATLDTGTVMGVSSNIFGTALPPKYVPPFSWGSAGATTTYEFGKALAVAEKVMARRSVTASAAYAGVFRHIFESSVHERTS